MSTSSVVQRFNGQDTGIAEINVHGVDAVSTPGSAILRPIIVAHDGSPTASKVLTWRLRIDLPFTYVHSVQFWFEPFTMPAGWEIRAAIHHTETPSVSLPGRPVTEFMEKTDLDSVTADFNLMPGYTTLDYPQAVADNTPVAGTFHSPYVHLWAKVNGDASPGPARGYLDMSPVPMPVSFSWVEL